MRAMGQAPVASVPFDSEGNDLPEGWAKTTLGEVCQHPQYGWTASAAKRPDGLKLLRTTDISSGNVNWDGVPVCSVEPDDPEKYLLHAEDIVISRAGSIGLSFMVRQCPMAAFASYLIRLRPRPPIRSEFISLFLQSPSYWSQVIEESAGIAIPNINATKLSAFSLPLPPLAEQKRIVAKVEELLARVNAARERLARVSAILKRFRQAVIAAACSGRLTADWRKSRGIPNGEGEVPASWRKVNVAGIASPEPRSIQSGPFGSNLHHSEFQATGVLAIGIDNVQEGRFSLGREHRISENKFEELKKYQARRGDVLITVMATIGRVCIVPDDLEPAIITKHVYRITVDREQVLPKYLMFSLMGDPDLISELNDQVRGQTRPGINGEILKSLPIRCPPLEEQLEIVRRVDALFKYAEKIEARIEAARGRADKIGQTVLAKAFRGELVPTEADLARTEGRSYESASTLLARVRPSHVLGEKADRGRDTCDVKRKG